MPTPFATATPSPAEVARDVTQIMTVFNSLGPVMVILGALIIALIILLYNARNIAVSTSATVTVLTGTIARQDAEIIDLKIDAKEFRKLHIDSLTAISDQATRSNDVLDAWNKRGSERDADQRLMAAALNTLVQDGSVPLRKLMADVTSIASVINQLDLRTAHLPELALSIPALRTELNSKLDSVMLEVTKRSTKPIPQIEMNANGTEPEQ
jgi:hypothetical protein